jgi:hypothetical protein
MLDEQQRMERVAIGYGKPTVWCAAAGCALMRGSLAEAAGWHPVNGCIHGTTTLREEAE